MNKLELFSHLLYECRKGVRSAALCTLKEECREIAISKLNSNQMAYFIYPLNNGRFNLYFGAQICIDVLKKICNKPMNRLSPEEDFMVGAILGYSMHEQCRRYTQTAKGGMLQPMSQAIAYS